MNLPLHHFRIEHADGFSTVWIDVEGRSVNVLSAPVWDELDQVLDALEARCDKIASSVFPVAFRSAKSKGFLAGADLRQIVAMKSDEEIQSFLLRGQLALNRLEASPLFTVALLEGACLGGGLEFAMACKQRWAIDDASCQFGMPETNLGLIPGWGGTQRLVQIVGVELALHMLMTGQPITIETAVEHRLVHRIVERSEIEKLLTQFEIDIENKTDGPPLLAEWLDRKVAYQPFTASQLAICAAVEAGLGGSTELGMQLERQQFYALLTSDFVREKLAKFAPKPVS